MRIYNENLVSHIFKFLALQLSLYYLRITGSECRNLFSFRGVESSPACDLLWCSGLGPLPHGPRPTVAPGGGGHRQGGRIHTMNIQQLEKMTTIVGRLTSNIHPNLSSITITKMGPAP